MAPRPKAAAVPKQVTVELSEDLAIQLAAFSKAYYDAPYAAIARHALTDYIQQTLDREPDRKSAFLAARARLTKMPAEAIRVVDRIAAQTDNPRLKHSS
jgi:hypothetical protein